MREVVRVHWSHCKLTYTTEQQLLQVIHSTIFIYILQRQILTGVNKLKNKNIMTTYTTSYKPPPMQETQYSPYASGRKAPLQNSYLETKPMYISPQPTRYNSLEPGPVLPVSPTKVNTKIIGQPRLIGQTVVSEAPSPMYQPPTTLPPLNLSTRPNQEPMVETVISSDRNYYSTYREAPKPPREQGTKKKRVCCPQWVLVLIGVFALAGLITAIILATNTNDTSWMSDDKQISNGQPATEPTNDGVILDPKLIAFQVPPLKISSTTQIPSHHLRQFPHQ